MKMRAWFLIFDFWGKVIDFCSDSLNHTRSIKPILVVLDTHNAQFLSYKCRKKIRNQHFEHFLAVQALKAPTGSDKNVFFGLGCHYPTTLVISGDPDKLIENELFVIKNWPEIDQIDKMTFFQKVIISQPEVMIWSWKLLHILYWTKETQNRWKGDFAAL